MTRLLGGTIDSFSANRYPLEQPIYIILIEDFRILKFSIRRGLGTLMTALSWMFLTSMHLGIVSNFYDINTSL